MVRGWKMTTIANYPREQLMQANSSIDCQTKCTNGDCDYFYYNENSKACYEIKDYINVSDIFRGTEKDFLGMSGKSIDTFC